MNRLLLLIVLIVYLIQLNNCQTCGDLGVVSLQCQQSQTYFLESAQITYQRFSSKGFITSIEVTPKASIVWAADYFLVTDLKPGFTYNIKVYFDGVPNPCVENVPIDLKTFYLDVGDAYCFGGSALLTPSFLQGPYAISIQSMQNQAAVNNVSLSPISPSAFRGNFASLQGTGCGYAMFDILQLGGNNQVQYRVNVACPPTLTITNPTSYTSIEVRDDGYQIVNPTGNNVYPVNYNKSYTIITKSQLCTQQSLQIFIDPVIPSVYTQANTLCPVLGEVTLRLESSEISESDVTIFYNGSQISLNEPFRIGDDDPYNYTINYCSLQFTRMFLVNDVKDIPLGHTITWPNTCDESPLPHVTFHFDPEYVQPSVDSSEGGGINMTEFDAEYNTQYRVYDSKCFTSSSNYVVYVSRQFPIFEIDVQPGDICFENYTFKIQNFQFFQSAEVSTFSGGEENIFYMDSEGYMSVPKASYLLKYVDKCGEYGEVQFRGLEKEDQNFDLIKANYTLIQALNCDGAKPYIILNVTLYSDQYGSDDPVQVSGQPGEAKYMYYTRNYCSYYYEYIIPDLYTHNTISEPGENTCKIMSDGVWDVSGYKFTDIYVGEDRTHYSVNSGEITGYKSGTYNVTFIYSRSKCDYTTEVTFGNTINLDIPVTTQYPTYCRNIDAEPMYDGSIVVDNYMNYDTFELFKGSILIVPTSNNQYLGLAQGEYVLNVTKGSCSGSVTISLISPEQLIKVQILRNPTCNNGGYGDGMLKITSDYLDLQNNTSFKFNGVATTLDNRYIVNFGSGIISLGYDYPPHLQECSFSYIFTIPEDDPKLNVKLAYDQYSLGGASQGYTVGVTSSNPSITINKLAFLQDPSITVPFARKLLYNPSQPIYSYGLVEDSYVISVQYNTFCYKNITYVYNSTIPVPDYEIIRTCGGEYSMDIFIKNANKFKSVTLRDMDSGNQHSMSSDGFIRNISTNYSPRLYYREPTSNIYDSLDLSVPSDFPEFKIDPMPQISYVLESCYGSKDGEIHILDQSGKYTYFLTLNNYVNDYFQETSDNLKFIHISAGTYKLAQQDKANPSCVRYGPVTLPGNEPEFLVKLNDICTVEQKSGSIVASIKSTNQLQNITYTLDRDDSETGIFDNIVIGQYTVLSAIDDFWCSRTYSQQVSISKNLIPLPTSDECATINYTPLNKNINTQLYIGSKDLGYNSTVNVKASNTEVTDLEEGTYTIFTVTPTCNVTSTLQVEACTKKKTNVGLAVGLAVGLTAAALIGLLIAYLVIRKRKQPVEVKPEIVKMETVSMFVGGKVNKIDDF